MKEAYEIYYEILRRRGHIYIRKGRLSVGPAKRITKDLEASIRAYKEDLRALASVLNINIALKLKEMLEDVFTNDEARFCDHRLSLEGVVALEEIERRIEELDANRAESRIRLQFFKAGDYSLAKKPWGTLTCKEFDQLKN